MTSEQTMHPQHRTTVAQTLRVAALSFAWTLAWQSSVWLIAGLLAGRLFALRPARAHRVLLLAILAAAEKPCTRSELQQAAGLKDREHFRQAYLEPLLATGWLEMTIPDKPRSSKQRYRATETGQKVLERREQE